jgi:hypothetical protein
MKARVLWGGQGSLSPDNTGELIALTRGDSTHGEAAQDPPSGDNG